MKTRRGRMSANFFSEIKKGENLISAGRKLNVPQ